MFAAVGAVFVLLEPLFVLDGVSTVAAVLAPDDHSLAKPLLAQDT